MNAKPRASWPLIEGAVEPVSSIDRPLFDAALRHLASVNSSAVVVKDAGSGQAVIGAFDGTHLATSIETFSRYETVSPEPPDHPPPAMAAALKA